MAGGSFGGGDGSAGNPYIVEDVADLLQIDINSRQYSNLYYSQYEDIDMAGYGDYPGIGGRNGPGFNGYYNGNGNSILNMNLNGPEASGLFHLLDNAEIENVVVVDGFASGGDSTLLCNISNGATFKNCFASGSVDRSGSNAGLLVRQLSNGYVLNCHASGSISSLGPNTGGAFGYVDYSTIEGCSFVGSVESTEGNIGGLIGLASGSVVKDSDATADISSSGNAGGLFGVIRSSRISDCNACANIVTKVVSRGSYEEYPSFAGGVAGQSDGTNYNNCHVSGFIHSFGFSGGFFGSVDSGAISNCSTFADVEVEKGVYDEYGGVWAGGFVPRMGSASYTDCGAFGDVYAYGFAAGFAMLEHNISSRLTRCYAFNDNIIVDPNYFSYVGTFTDLDDGGSFPGSECYYNENVYVSSSVRPFEYRGIPTSNLKMGGFYPKECRFKKPKRTFGKCKRITLSKLIGGIRK